MNNEYNSERFKKLLADYERSLENESSSFLDTDDFSEIAQFYYEKGEFDKAKKAINTALRIFPGSVAPLSFMARYALLKENDAKKADEIADEIADKDDPDYVLLKAEILIAENHPDEADEFLEESYEGYSDDDYSDDMPLDVANLYADYEEMDYAEKWLERSDEFDEDLYKEVKARILMFQGKYAESDKLLNELIDSDPYSSYYWNQLAAEKMLNDDLNGSVTSSDYALAIDPDNRDAILNKGNGLLGLENYKEAEKLFRRYTKLEPRKDTGYIMTAISLIAQNRPQEASQSLRMALKFNNEDPMGTWQGQAEILHHLILVENYLEHFGNVGKYLDKLEALYRDNIDNITEFGKLIADIDIARGHICLEQERIEQALNWFDQAVTESGSDAMTFVKIAISAYECGYIRYAYKLLHEILYVEHYNIKQGFVYLALCCKHFGYVKEQKWAKQMAKKEDNNNHE